MKLSEEMLSARHPRIKGILVSATLLCLSSVALLNYRACMLLLLDVAPLLACMEPGFDTALQTELCCCCCDVLLKA